MIESIKTGFKLEEDKGLHFKEFLTENNYYLNINILNGKIVFNAYLEEIENVYYSKEFSLKELWTLAPRFAKDKKIEKVYDKIVFSIMRYPVKAITKENDDSKLNIIIKLFWGFKDNKEDTEATNFQLIKLTRTKLEIFNLLINKIYFLNSDKQNYMTGYKMRKLIEEKNEENKNDRIELLEKSIDLLEQKFQTYINANLLSCSNILKTSEEWKIITEKLKSIDPKYNNILFKLVYKATRDGDTSLDFHNKCDKIGPNVTLVLTKDNVRFGGFTEKNWEHLKEDINKEDKEVGSSKLDINAFCFSINLNKVYPNYVLDKGAIFCCNNYGPTFCRNIFALNNKMLKRGGYCLKKNHSNFQGQISDFEISGGKKIFGINEVEVLEILFI